MYFKTGINDSVSTTHLPVMRPYSENSTIPLGVFSICVLLLLVAIPFTPLLSVNDPDSASHEAEESGTTLIKGIRFTSFKQGNRIAVISIDYLGLTGKKNGFIRLGAWKVLRCDHVNIDIFPPEADKILAGSDIIEMLKETEPRGNPNDDQASKGNRHPVAKRINTLTGRKLLHVKGIEFHHITIGLHASDGSDVEISGDFGEMALNSRNLAITGNVSITNSASRQTLYTELARWNLSCGIITVPRGFSLNSEGESVSGIGIKTDLRLNRITRAEARNSKMSKERGV